MSFPRVTVEGDTEGGWMVEIHDGDVCQQYSPLAPTAAEARASAWMTHFGSPEPAPLGEPVDATEHSPPAP